MTTHRGSTGDPEQDMELRQALGDSSLPQLFEAFDLGLEEGLADPVVLLMDCEDEIGSRFARGWVGDSAVDAALKEQRPSAGEEPITITLALALDFTECQTEIPQYLPYLAETFQEPPPLEGFLAVVITSGGAATFTVPFAARP